MLCFLLLRLIACHCTTVCGKIRGILKTYEQWNRSIEFCITSQMAMGGTRMYIVVHCLQVIYSNYIVLSTCCCGAVFVWKTPSIELSSEATAWSVCRKTAPYMRLLYLHLFRRWRRRSNGNVSPKTVQPFLKNFANKQKFPATWSLSVGSECLPKLPVLMFSSLELNVPFVTLELKN